jgi:integrase/recombinase XerC
MLEGAALKACLGGDAESIREAAMENPQNQNDQQRLTEIIADWSADLLINQSRSVETKSAYVSDIAHLLRFLRSYFGCDCGLKEFLLIDSTCWRAWLSSQKQMALCAKTVARRLSALKSLFRYCVAKKLIQDHPVLSARVPRFAKGLPHPAEYETITAMLKQCAEERCQEWMRKRDEALILLLYNSGMRISEALGIKRQEFLDIVRQPFKCEEYRVEAAEHADKPRKSYRFVKFLTITGKGNKVRQVPVLKSVLQKISEYVEACPFSGENLFLGVKGVALSRHCFANRIKSLRLAIGAQHTLTPHALRHSCATHLLESSDDLRGIQELLGHASLSSTQIYTEITQQTAAKAYSAAHPRSRRKTKT